MPICRKRRRRDKVAMLAAASASSASSGGGRGQHGEQNSGRGVRCNESDLVVVKMGDC